MKFCSFFLAASLKKKWYFDLKGAESWQIDPYNIPPGLKVWVHGGAEMENGKQDVDLFLPC